MKINRSTYYFALIFLLFFNSFYPQQESKSTNIIFYLSDDQDLLDYGVYGNPKVETSNVDLLATQGIKFTNFYNNSRRRREAKASIIQGRLRNIRKDNIFILITILWDSYRFDVLVLVYWHVLC